MSEAHALARHADWTIHLGLVVKQCAALLGARAQPTPSVPLST